VDVVSPLPVPWNYGHVEGELGGDGDPLDALLLGPAVRVGHRCRARVVGVVHFVDAGLVDDKLVCGALPPGGRWAVRAFFLAYTALKRGLQRARGRAGFTGVRGIDWA
jgi:inorganic pyrophosphatase